MSPIRTCLSAVALVWASSTVMAEDVINAVHFTPAPNGFAQSFLKYVEKVNERGAGVVRIDVRGGPEVVPNPQIGSAQQSGLVDMIHAPAGLYLELVPEGEVLSASTGTPWEHRENGGWELLDSIYKAKGNAKLIAHLDSGVGFHIWTTEEPVRTDDGMIDFGKLTVRASPLYKDMFDELGATMVIQPAGDAFTSLERGVINGLAYPALGFTSFGWERFTKYRLEPEFMQTDVLVSMNLDAWNALSDESKAILDEVGQEYERESREAMIATSDELKQKLVDDGMQVFEMSDEGAERFLEIARESAWTRMERRDMTHIAELRALFQ